MSFYFILYDLKQENDSEEFKEHLIFLEVCEETWINTDNVFMIEGIGNRYSTSTFSDYSIVVVYDKVEER